MITSIKLEKLLQSDKNLLIAIDGPSGSGKTTLVQELARKYDITVIHMDDYFLPEEKKTEERLKTPGGNVDLERIKTEVFEHLEDDKIPSHHFNCKTQTLETRPELPRHQKVIIEGVYSCHPDLADYYDYKIVLHVSRETQLQRIESRSPSHIYHRFINEWIPLEDRYFNAFSIFENADIILENE